MDISEWPLVRVWYPAAENMEGFIALFAYYGELAKRGERIAWLIDMAEFNPILVSATMRREAARVFEAYRPVLGGVTTCEARVIRSALVRGVVTAFDWLTGNKWPCANFAGEAEARLWIDAQRAVPRARRR